VAVASIAATVAMTARPASSGTSALRPCDGSERWDIKTLADIDVGQVQSTVKHKFVQQLWAMNRPSHFSTKIRNPGAETTVYEVKASLIEARWVNDPRRRNAKTGKIKKGGDLDIHLVIAPGDDPTDRVHTMVVEFPFPRCIADDARWKNRVVAARQAFIDACGQPSGSFHSLNEKPATIRGVGFFDRPHATGAAKNGIELHPVTRFSSPDCSTP
jgi:hypothetical protein